MNSKDATAKYLRFQKANAFTITGPRRLIILVLSVDIAFSAQDFLGLESGHSLLFEVEMLSSFQHS
jgi:hypothetical protein